MGKTKKVDGSISISDRFNAEVGDINSEPLEVTEAIVEELLVVEREKEERRESIRSNTRHYLNGENEWKLIAKSYNDILDWEHTTMAMEVGNSGVLVCLKEAVGQKIDTTMCFVSGASLSSYDDENGNKKYVIR